MERQMDESELNYTIHIKEFVEGLGYKAIDLVRFGVAVGTAYRIWNGEEVGLDTTWKIYVSMRRADVVHPSGRAVKFSDLVTLPE